MIRPWVLVAWAAVAMPVGVASLTGPVGLGVALVVESLLAMVWAVVLVRGAS